MAEEASVGTVEQAALAKALKAIKPAIARQFGGRADAAPVHLAWTTAGLSVGGHNQAFYVDYLVSFDGVASRGTDRVAADLYVRHGELTKALGILRGYLTLTFGRKDGAPQVVITDGTTTVTCGQVVVNRPRLEPLPVPDEAVEQIADEDIVRLIRQIGRCASDDDLRPILTLVHFERRRIVATDSYRMAVGETAGHVLPPGDIPKPTLRWLPQTGDWTFQAKDQHLWWTDGPVSVYCPGLPGPVLQNRKGKRPIKVKPLGFPEYLPLYEPSAMYPRVQFNRADLHAAVRRIADATKVCKDNAAVHVEIGGTNCKLYMSMKTSNPPIEMALDVVCEKTLPAAPVIAFNPHFLAEALDSFDTETVFIAHVDPMKPARIGSVEDDSLGLLLMPVRSN